MVETSLTFTETSRPVTFVFPKLEHPVCQRCGRYYPQIRPAECTSLMDAAGAALLACQALEDRVKQWLFILAQKELIETAPDRATEILEGRDKKSLGQIIGILHADGGVTDEALQNALVARNELIHHFFQKNSARMEAPFVQPDTLRDFRALLDAVLWAEQTVSIWTVFDSAASKETPPDDVRAMLVVVR
jgi:hypothetical protein